MGIGDLLAAAVADVDGIAVHLDGKGQTLSSPGPNCVRCAIAAGVVQDEDFGAGAAEGRREPLEDPDDLVMDIPGRDEDTHFHATILCAGATGLARVRRRPVSRSWTGRQPSSAAMRRLQPTSRIISLGR